MRQLANALRELRQNAELSQNALAEKAGVSPAFIYKLENEEYGTLSIDKIRAIAKGLGMTFRDFLDAAGLLESTATPKADLALASALRARKLKESQVKKVISYIDFIEQEDQK